MEFQKCESKIDLSSLNMRFALEGSRYDWQILALPQGKTSPISLSYEPCKRGFERQLRYLATAYLMGTSFSIRRDFE